MLLQLTTNLPTTIVDFAPIKVWVSEGLWISPLYYTIYVCMYVYIYIYIYIYMYTLYYTLAGVHKQGGSGQSPY